MGKLLITGATGFVGRQVVRKFLEQGLELLLVVRPGSSAKVQNLERVETIESPSLFHEDEAWWCEALKGVDTVVHLAWYAEPGKYLTAAENLDCLSGTLTMAKASVKAGVRRFVGIGTCFEYDLDAGTLLIGTPLKPRTVYAAAKASAFMTLSEWLPGQGVAFAWCRLFYLYGDGEDERRLVPYLRRQLAAGMPAELTSGTQVRDFMDVREAASRICSVALGSTVGPVNVCSGVPITVRELAENIADQYGRRDLLRFGARPDNLVDPPYVVGVP